MSQTAKTRDTPDSVAAQLRDLERQGGAMARLAHIAAGLLLAAFSAGSLVSISHAAFIAFLAALGAHQADIPDAISLAVNLLLVLAADVALLYAASVLRVLIAAQAPTCERRVHVWAMVGASLLEASTYLYLAWQFDRPSDLFLWTIVLARAIGAPLFAAYLSMARPLPVAPRDVAYQASLAAGRGVVRDVAILAADPGAPLERKARIYTASALMTTQDRTRFDGIIDAVAATAPEGAGGVQTRQGAQTVEAASTTTESIHDGSADDSGGGRPSPDVPDRPPAPTVSAPPHVVTLRGNRRPKPAAVRRRERAAAEALDDHQRSAAWAMLDADGETSANRIAQQLHVGHRKARRFIQSWQRRQTHRTA